MHRSIAIALLVSLGSCGGSGPAHKLEGSLSSVMDLGYDDAVLTFGGTEFTVSFKRRRNQTPMGMKLTCADTGASCDTSLSVTARLEQAPMPDGGMEALRGGDAYDLTQVLTSGLPRGVVARNVLDDPRGTTTPFTTIRIGQISFKNIPQQSMGLAAGGEFHVTFDNGVEFASGKTVFGPFQALFP